MKPTRRQFLTVTNSENAAAVDLVCAAITRDSCYMTAIAWNPETEEIEAWETNPQNKYKSGDETLVRLATFTFDSPENDTEFLQSYLEELVGEEHDFAGTCQNSDTIAAIVQAGIKALSLHLSNGENPDPEGIREAAAAKWDNDNRREFVESILENIMEELED